jgi:hypothetical protein
MLLFQGTFSALANRSFAMPGSRPNALPATIATPLPRFDWADN